MPNLRRAWLAPAVSLGFLLLYAATAARTVQGFDCGELTAMAHNWGVAHPPGFATFALLAGAFAHASPLPAAHTLALLSALAGALACGLLCATLLHLNVRPVAALTAACAWGLLAPTWTLHTEQEVFATSHLAVALLVWLAIREVKHPTRLGPLWLGLASAAGAGVHTVVVLAAPVVALALWQPPQRPKRTLLFALGILLGLLPLLYLPLASLHGGQPSWGRIDSLAALVHHVLRSDYGVFSLALGEHAGYGAVLGRYVSHLAVDGALLLPVLLAVGLATSLRDVPPRTIAVSFLLSLAFLFAFATPETPWWHEVTQRFFPGADLYAALLAGLGLERLLGLTSMKLQTLLIACVIFWGALLTLHAVPAGPAASRGSLSTYADALLDSLEPNALLIGQGDDDASALWEAQLARHKRPDVGFVLQALLPWPWYAETTARVASGYRQPERKAGIRLLIEHALHLGRPVYLTGGLPPSLRGRFATLPAGLAVRVVPADEPPPDPQKIFEQLQAFFAQHPVPRPFAWQARRAIDVEVTRRYAAPWAAVAGALQATGHPDLAAQALERFRAVLAK